MICCYQVTKIFRSGHDCSSTSSARTPCYFRLVIREVSINAVLTLPLSSVLFGFLISAGPRDGSSRTLSRPLVLSLLVDAGCCVGITASCRKDVGDTGVAELEEPVERPGTTIGT